MLLNRKKINRIAKWFAIMLALIFALSGVVLGVGSKTGNVFAGCAQSSSSVSASGAVKDRESFLLGQIKKNPKDADSIMQLATLYAGEDVKRYQDAISWFNKYLALVPKDINVRLEMGSIYLNDLNDPASAAKILTQATTIDPTNANAFLQLGLAEKDALQNQAAIQAWTRYLQLAPGSSYASQIRDQINQLAHPAQTAPPTTPAAPAPSH